MSAGEFERGYWYVPELRNFARELGVSGTTRLRKDELERAIVAVLSGTAKPATTRRPRTGPKDLDAGLRLDLPVRNYTSNRTTKDFIAAEARRLEPDIGERSGVWYRLNRWREARLAAGDAITYADLVRQYVALNSQERFDRIPHGRYINFVADFLAAEPDADRAAAIRAWHEVKEMNVPKDYASWRAARR